MLKPPQGQGHTVKQLRSETKAPGLFNCEQEATWTKYKMDAKVLHVNKVRLGDLTNIMHILIFSLNSSTKTIYSDLMHTHSIWKVPLN